MTENPFHQLMNPRSIATVGAGNNPMKMGTLNILSIIKDGFPGALYPIHPKDDSVLGLKAYRTVADLPEAPDLALFVVPAELVPGLMEEFGEIGTKRIIVITAGFKEIGDEGKREEERLNQIAQKYGIRFVGPNCMGILNTELPLNTTVMPIKFKPGMLGIASQSGTYVTQTFPYLGKRGICLSKAISTGNEANMSIIDAMEYLGEDEQTRAIALYIEGIRDVPRFLETARRITPHKPIIAQYVGGSSAGARAGLSHTGAMAGPDYLYEGLFKQAGIIRMHSVEDLYLHGWALATQPPLKGNRIGIITNSGGPGTAMAHVCEQGGFQLPEFSPMLQEKIKPLLPPHAPSGNPVDLTFVINADTITDKVPKLVMQSGEVDGVVLHGAMRSGFIIYKHEHFADLMNNTSIDDMIGLLGDISPVPFSLPFTYGIPLVLSSFFDRDDDLTTAFEDHNIPVCDSPEKAARTMVSLLRYREVAMRKPYGAPEMPAVSSQARQILEEARKRGLSALDEFSAKKFLACYGIPVTDERLIGTEDKLSEAVKDMDYPLVMKACNPGILHKSERGLVRLNIQDIDGAMGAFRDIRSIAGGDTGVIVYSMVSGVREFMAGMTRYPGFAPAVLFGLGGIFTESLRDTCFRCAPLSLPEAEEMLDDIKSAQLLGAYRGMPAVNRDKLASILQRLGFLPLLHPEIAEIDINPLIISGSEPVAVDALIVLA